MEVYAPKVIYQSRIIGLGYNITRLCSTEGTARKRVHHEQHTNYDDQRRDCKSYGARE